MTSLVDPVPGPIPTPPTDNPCAVVGLLRVSLSRYVPSRADRPYGAHAKASNHKTRREINGFCPTSPLGQ